MKKVAFTLAGLLVIMFAGCGQGSSSSNDVSSGNADNPSGNAGSEVVIDNGNVSNTTVTNEFGINPSLGTPPPLPAS